MRDKAVVMRFGAAIHSGFSHYADASGRASRSAYCWWILFANVAVAIPVLMILAMAVARVAVSASVVDGVIWMTRLLGLGLLVPTAAVTVRRLHDANRSAWWMLAAMVPALAGAVFVTLTPTLSAVVLAALVPVLGLVVLLVLAAMPGTPGPNRYGVRSDSTAIVPAPDTEVTTGQVPRVHGAVGT